MTDSYKSSRASTHADQLEEALLEWWKAHRPVGWTEDQHRSCPHVNLATKLDSLSVVEES